MSKEIRDLIVPRPGYYMIDIDYSQVEYRVMAALAGELDVIEDFKDPFADFHELMASRMFNVPLDEVTGIQRRDGKTLNFGVSFGMGDYSLAQNLFKDTSPESVEKAAKKRHEYFSGVPCIRDMFINIKDFAELNGYVETYFFRRRYLPDIQSKNFRIKENERRKAGNTRVQGTAADIMKIAFCRLAKLIKVKGFDIKIVGTIHDELLLEVNNKINPWQVVKMAREAMELVIPRFPPLYTGITVCRDWSDGKVDCLEIPIPLADIRINEVDKGMLNESVANPFYYVVDDIKWFCKEFIRGYIYNYMESIGEDKDAGNTTLEMAKRATGSHKAIKILKKYESILIEIDGRPGEEVTGKGLEIIMQELFGDRLVESNIEDGNNFDNIKVIDAEIDEDSLREIYAVDEEYLDEDIDGFGEERVIINDIALSRLKNKVEELELIPDKTVASAESAYRNSSNIKIINNVCYININGISKINLRN